MPTRWTIAALCVLLGALAAHARILDVRGVGADDDDPYCLTCDGVSNQRYQLIRGEDEVDKCNKQIYCDCLEHTQKKCEGWGLAFNPDKQKCAYMFRCESWLNEHTSTPAPPTPTAPTGTPPTVTEPTATPTTAPATTATPTTAPATKATPTIAPASTTLHTVTAPTVTTVTQTTPTRPPTVAPQTGTPGTQKTTVSPDSPPTPVPVPATTPSSAWANKATALTIVCLAAVIAL